MSGRAVGQSPEASLISISGEWNGKPYQVHNLVIAGSTPVPETKHVKGEGLPLQQTYGGIDRRSILP